MKKTKFWVTLLLLLFCFVLNSEFYQSYLTGFLDDFSMAVLETEENTDARLFQKIDEVSQKTGRPLFVAVTETAVNGKTDIELFCSENAEKLLKQQYGLKEGSYKAPLLGETEMHFEKLPEADASAKQICLYTRGSKSELIRLNQRLSEFCSLEGFSERGHSNEKGFSVGLFLVFVLFYVLISALDLQFRKKEIFLKISLGQSKGRAVLENSALDAAVLFLCFFLLRALLKPFFYTDYNLPVYIGLLALSAILNTCLYLSIYRIRYKEILYGGNIGEATVSNCYLVKVASMVLTVTLLCGNLALLSVNLQPLWHEKDVQPYKTKAFVSLLPAVRTEENFQKTEEMYGALLLNGLRQNMATFSFRECSAESDREIILSNDASLFVQSGMEQPLPTEQSFVVLPYDCDLKTESDAMVLEQCKAVLSMDLGVTCEDLPIYHAKKPSKALFFHLNDRKNAQMGYGVSENPIFIYCKTEKEIAEAVEAKELYNPQARYALYQSSYLEQTHLEKEGIKTEIFSAKGVFAAHKSGISRTVMLSIVMIALQLCIDLSMISVLIRFEYSAHAVELSLKKLMGYSVFSKNKSLIFLNLYAAAIGVMTAVLIFYLLGLPYKKLAVVTGFGVLLAESLLLLWRLHRFEKTKVIQILKGGAL